MAEKSETALKLECLKLAHAMLPQAFADTVLTLARDIHGWVTTPETTSARGGRPHFSAEPRRIPTQGAGAVGESRPLRVLNGGDRTGVRRASR
jgi:hypothetical protein